MARSLVLPILVIALTTPLLVGCDGSSGAQAETGPVTLTWTGGRDPENVYPSIMAECSRESQGRYELQQLVLPPSVDAQREQIIRRLAAGDDSIDILGMDVIWTAEFSEAGWLVDMTDAFAPIRDEFIPAAFATVEYQDSIWGLPMNTNVALMYYRTDLVDGPPATWQEMAENAHRIASETPDMEGYVWQANQYEGLTVTALELLHAAGAEIITEDGSGSMVADGDAALQAYTFIRDLFESGTTPASVSTFQEEEARQFFQSGRAVYMRNWPYASSLFNEDGSPVKGRFALAPLPAFASGTSAGVLGGLNWGVSTHSHHPELAREAIECMTSPRMARRIALEKAELPTRRETYDDPEVQDALPFLADAHRALEDARVRPITPYYNDVTVALQRVSHRVLTGSITPEQGVQQLHEAVELAVNGEGEI